MTTDALSDSDELALNRLIFEVAWRVSHHKGDTIHELYTDDAVMEIGSPANEHCAGREAIIEWGRHRHETVKIVYTNMRWESDGPHSALGSCTVTSYLDPDVLTPGTTVPNVVGETTFRCLRTDEGWRIAHSQLEFCFKRSTSRTSRPAEVHADG